MNESGTPVDANSARPLELRRRVKRGIVASYIHELSERHTVADAQADGAPAPVPQPEEV